MLCALIMAGGKGSRFWPLSTEEKPKQFLNLIGTETMIQMTIKRIKGVVPMERIFVCTAKKYVSLVKQQVPDLNERNIIVEPEERNTAPCIALSTLIINKYYKDSNVVVLPSDHIINNEDKFRNIVLTGSDYLKKNKNTIITLGMKPDRAETGYGYIKFGKKEVLQNDNMIVNVERFVEKPSREKAEQYLLEGSYLWNSGVFIWNCTHILNEIKKYMPETYEVLFGIENISMVNLQAYINENYKKTEATSIDYGILEKSDSIVVMPSDIGWDDVGTWRSIERYREKDLNNNIISENVKVIESNSNITINNSKEIIMIGIKDIMTVETDKSIFIVNKDYIDNLREYKEFL